LQDKNPNATIKQTWVPYNRISNNLKRAIIASEDANFSEHEGVDWEALQKAYEKNSKKQKVVAGGSTITQQLAKNLFLSGSRSYVRKGQELIITYMLESLMEKQRIFEIYLNVVEFGTGIFGAEAAITQQLAKNLFLSGSRSYVRKGQELIITYMLENLMEKERIFEIYLNVVEFGTGTFGAEAAARHYYKVSAAGLSAGQAAKLAVMLPNPRFYDRHRDTGYLNRRTSVILRRMGAAELP